MIPFDLQFGSQTGLADYTRWVNTTDALWRYLRRDFSDFREQLSELYPQTAGSMVQQTVPFVYRVARELATFYLRAVTRRYYFRDGMKVPVETEQRINQLYRDSDVNSYLRQFQEQLVALGNAVLFVWPSRDGFRLLVVPPHHNQVYLRDPTSYAVSNVNEWYLSLPLSQDGTTGLVTYGTALITDDKAVWQTGPGNLSGKGVWREDGTNPFGRIPAVVGRMSAPAPGEFFAPAPEDLLDAQRALCFGYTDQAHIARLQSYGQPVVTGSSHQFAESLLLGPENIIGLPDESMKFEFVNASPPLAEYKAIMESYARTVSAQNGMNPYTFERSTGITAVAKQVELQDRETERSRNILEFELVENNLYTLMSQYQNVLAGVEIYPDLKVEAEYHMPVMPADPLHEAQAIEMEMLQGRTTAAQELSRATGVTIDDARVRVRQNLEETRVNRAMVSVPGDVVQGKAPSMTVVGDE